jgi:hypothetical protein
MLANAIPELADEAVFVHLAEQGQETTHIGDHFTDFGHLLSQPTTLPPLIFRRLYYFFLGRK